MVVNNKFNKIRITGGSGSGKSYLGRRISDYLGVSLTSLDELRYDFSRNYRFDDCNRRSAEEMLDLLKKVTVKKRWVIEGGYYDLTKHTYDSADVIIFLKPRFFTRLFNTVKRFFKSLFCGKYEGLFNFFKLTSYNVGVRRKWRRRESFIKNSHGEKVLFFSCADDAFDWFVKNN